MFIKGLGFSGVQCRETPCTSNFGTATATGTFICLTPVISKNPNLCRNVMKKYFKNTLFRSHFWLENCVCSHFFSSGPWRKSSFFLDTMYVFWSQNDTLHRSVTSWHLTPGTWGLTWRSPSLQLARGGDSDAIQVLVLMLVHHGAASVSAPWCCWCTMMLLVHHCAADAASGAFADFAAGGHESLMISFA